MGVFTLAESLSVRAASFTIIFSNFQADSRDGSLQFWFIEWAIPGLGMFCEVRWTK
jgi:hypothetical protein